VTAPFGCRAAGVIAREAHGAYVVVRARDPIGPAPRAGQFYMLRTAERWGGGEDERPFLPRAFSVLRAHEDELHFLIEDVGPGTKRLCELEPGEELLLVGPLGNGFTGPRDNREPLLVGGGVGHHGLVTELLEDELDERGEELEVYACGPPAMLEAVRAICADRGIPAQLALESGMACGFGACFGCVVPTVDGYLRLCIDGPVLAADGLRTAVFAGAGH